MLEDRPAAVSVAAAAWDDADGQRLTAAQQAELRARYDGGQEPGTPPSAADVAVVLVARDPAGEAEAGQQLVHDTSHTLEHVCEV